MAYSDEKSYGSAKYHGMKVGGLHNWTYPDGQWTERKLEPDRWEVTFTSLKRRNRRAPSNSGAEVGSGYHWLIVAHQWVDKLDANTYATQLEGTKYLIAFKKPDWPVWNTQFKNQKRRAKDKAIAALQDVIKRLEASAEDFEEVGDQAAMVELATRFHAEALEKETEEKTKATARPGVATPTATKPAKAKAPVRTAATRGRSRPGRKRRAPASAKEPARSQVSARSG
jgi:hypothetical protein